MNENNVKILVLVTHGPYQPWLKILHEGQMTTWAKNSYPDFRIVHFSGIPIPTYFHKLDMKLYSMRWSRQKIIGHVFIVVDYVIKKIIRNWRPKVENSNKYLSNNKEDWLVRMPDLANLLGHKMLAAFENSLRYDYDFLVSTITSAYICREQLLSELNKVSRFAFAGGHITKFDNIHFQQGSFRVYSKDVIEMIIKNRKNYPHWLPEDLAMGKLIKTLNLNLQDLPSQLAYSISELKEIDDPKFNQACHFRCKGARVANAEMRNDIEIMRAIHDRKRLN